MSAVLESSSDNIVQKAVIFLKSFYRETLLERSHSYAGGFEEALTLSHSFGRTCWNISCSVDEKSSESLDSQS